MDQVGWTTGTVMIELTPLNFKWNCQLELSLATAWYRPVQFFILLISGQCQQLHKSSMYFLSLKKCWSKRITFTSGANLFLGSLLILPYGWHWGSEILHLSQPISHIQSFGTLGLLLTAGEGGVPKFLGVWNPCFLVKIGPHAKFRNFMTTFQNTPLFRLKGI